MIEIKLKPDAKILIIQLRRIGDVLLTTPALRALRQKYPQARIDFLVEKPGGEILLGNPNLNRLLIYDKRARIAWIKKIRAEKYDLILDFMRNPRTTLITLLSGARHRVCFRKKWRDYACNIKVEPDPVSKYVPAFKLDLLKPLGVVNGDVSLDIKVLKGSEQTIGSWLAKEGVRENDRLVGISPTSRRAARVWRKEGYAAIADMMIKKCGEWLRRHSA